MEITKQLESMQEKFTAQPLAMYTAGVGKIHKKCIFNFQYISKSQRGQVNMNRLTEMSG